MERLSDTYLYENCKLPRSIVLKTRNEISEALKSGRKFKCNSTRIILYRVYEESNFKVAFLVSKKLGKKAWIRNLMKRWLRELFRTTKKSFPRGCHIIISVGKPYKEVVFEELKKEYNQILSDKKFTDFTCKILSEGN
ncbi:MAG: ribonuclease P protein component [Candidatus Delongbacteria bacterium]|nr:ribonuclease P protein component [Candidatus Delongbacteria bacterium]MBN2836947.1 ribonuclease P protein component [Candidatus Delongbacteria bacterium]